ncbi:hypothetical protein M011DRAFT_288326 [Sporormia fimetaria CBS 119925]|uniref:Uncharacterized protein n=1 Tax=Sporormia fimetaria CBS 119925 TaxID=1340428 RepID=A0A6A6UXX1_9PLEO|nr:hypothetical protein M011DRAFT_288326 [Sporormia fimetaria CBS 119925]
MPGYCCKVLALTNLPLPIPIRCFPACTCSTLADTRRPCFSTTSPSGDTLTDYDLMIRIRQGQSPRRTSSGEKSGNSETVPVHGCAGSSATGPRAGPAVAFPLVNIIRLYAPVYHSHFESAPRITPQLRGRQSRALAGSSRPRRVKLQLFFLSLTTSHHLTSLLT